MAKNSYAKSSAFPCKTVLLRLPFFVLPFLLILLVFHGSPDKTVFEAYSPVQESPYHNTVELSLDISALHNKISVAESIWSKFAYSRRGAIAAVRNDSAELLDFLKYFPPTFDCPYLMEPIGDELGNSGWVCGLELFEKEDECVFYSIGTSYSEEYSEHKIFETELLRRTNNCHVSIYDFFDEFKVDPSYLQRVEYLQIRNISDANGTIKLNIPIVSALLKTNGHGWLDILKIDLDTYGLSIIKQMLLDYEEVLPFGQLQVRFTLYGDHPFESYIKLFENLEKMGLRPFHANVEEMHCEDFESVDSLTLEYSFINIKGKHVLLTAAT